MRPLFFGILVAAAVSNATVGQSNDFPTALVSASFKRMALAFACKDAIGLSHYQDARIAAEGIIQVIGASADEATLAVDRMEKKLKADPLANRPDADAGKCLEQMNDASYELSVLLAEYRTQKH